MLIEYWVKSTRLSRLWTTNITSWQSTSSLALSVWSLVSAHSMCWTLLNFDNLIIFSAFNVIWPQTNFSMISWNVHDYISTNICICTWSVPCASLSLCINTVLRFSLSSRESLRSWTVLSRLRLWEKLADGEGSRLRGLSLVRDLDRTRVGGEEVKSSDMIKERFRGFRLELKYKSGFNTCFFLNLIDWNNLSRQFMLNSRCPEIISMQL